MKKAARFWDKAAEKYDKAEKRFEPVHSNILQHTKKYLHENDIVLDYGCATGSKVFELAGSVKEIYGIDISSKMIEKAEKRLIDKNAANISFSQADIFDKKIMKSFYSVITAFAVLHLIENSHEVIHRTAELLKPGGLFLSATPCFKEKMDLSNKLQMPLYSILSKTGIIPIKLNRFKFSDLENLLSNENYEIMETEKYFHEMSSYFIAARKL